MEPPTHIWDAAQTVDLVEFISKQDNQKQAVLAKAFLDPSTTTPSDRCLLQKKLCLQLLQRTEWMEWMRQERWVILGEKGLRPTERWGEANPVAEKLDWLQMQHIRICSRLQNYDSPAALGKHTPERKIWEEYKKKGDSDWYFAYHKLWMKYSPAAQTSSTHPLAKMSLKNRIGSRLEVENDDKSDEEDDDDIEFVEPVVKAKVVEKVGLKGGKEKDTGALVGDTAVRVSMARVPETSVGKAAPEAVPAKRVSTSTTAPAAVSATPTSTALPSRRPSTTASNTPSSQIPKPPIPSPRLSSGPSHSSATPEAAPHKRPPVSRSTPAGPSKLPSVSRPRTPPIDDQHPTPVISNTSTRKRVQSSVESTMRPPSSSSQTTAKRPRPSSPPIPAPELGANDAGNPIVIDSDDEDGDEEDNTPLTRPIPKRRSSPPLTRRKLHHRQPSSPDRQPTPPVLPTPPTPPIPSPSRLTRSRQHIESPLPTTTGIPTPEPTPPSEIDKLLNPRGHAKEEERLRRLAKMDPPPRPIAAAQRKEESSDESDSSYDEDSPIPENQYSHLVLETSSTMLSFEHRPPGLGAIGPRLSFRDGVEDQGSSRPVTPPMGEEDMEMIEAEEADIIMAGDEEVGMEGEDDFVQRRTRPSSPTLHLSSRPPTPPLFTRHHSNRNSPRSSTRSESSEYIEIPTAPPSPSNTEFLDIPAKEVEGSSVDPQTFVGDIDMDDEDEEEDDDMLNLSGTIGDEDDFLSALGGVVGLTT